MENVPVEDWKPNESYEDQFQKYRLPATDELVGKELKFYFDTDNRVLKYVFNSIDSLKWEILDGPDKGKSGEEKYLATSIAPNIYFLDYIRQDMPNVDVAMALDLESWRATVLISTAPAKGTEFNALMKKLDQGFELGMMDTEYWHANINPPSSDKPVIRHERTTDLVGKRIKYAYSSAIEYEHIYLTDRLYTWHCVKGTSLGRADTDSCDYFKIAPDIYFFVWREKLVSINGAVLINFKEMRSTGIQFLGEGLGSEAPFSIKMGAYAKFLNRTEYWEDS